MKVQEKYKGILIMKMKTESKIDMNDIEKRKH